MAKQSKIMERIRKLLNMAEDASSPNEAAIAAGRARKLMDIHQIALADVEDLAETHQFGEVVVQAKRPHWKQWMAVCVADYNDCIVRSARGGFTFQGLKDDTVMCQYLMDYLTTNGNFQYSVFQSCQKGAAKRAYEQVFMEGFSKEVNQKIRELILQRKQAGDGKQLLVLKKGLVESHFGAAKYSKSKSKDLDPKAVVAHDAGRSAGKSQSIHTAMGRDHTEALQ